MLPDGWNQQGEVEALLHPKGATNIEATSPIGASRTGTIFNCMKTTFRLEEEVSAPDNVKIWGVKVSTKS